MRESTICTIGLRRNPGLAAPQSVFKLLFSNSNATKMYTYTPNPNYFGGDSFTFTATDGTVTSSAATITLTVTEVNDPPVPGPYTLTTAENAPGSVTVAQLTALASPEAIEQSTTWRATTGLRAMAERLPQPVRRNLRRAARAAYWVLIRHRMPSRLRFLREQQHPWAAGAALDLISRRYADIRADIKSRLVAATPLSEATSDGPLISIVLPVFRPPLSLIEKTISSVLRQSYPHWELCIVDDGSEQPKLAQRLQHYAKNDGRIKLRISDTNAGIAAASNLALSLATGGYVAFLDHDDLLTCDALECIARPRRIAASRP